jgi:hypothetical protein
MRPPPRAADLQFVVQQPPDDVGVLEAETSMEPPLPSALAVSGI